MRYTRQWLIPVMLGLASAGCDSAGQICTQEFRVATVALLDAQSAPVTDATVATTLVRTGQVVPVTSFMDFVSGTYPVLDDGAVALFRDGTPEDFTLTVSRPTQASVTATYRFEAAGGCHIAKVSGADTLHLP